MPLAPGDWFLLGVALVVLCAGLIWLIALVSDRFTTEVPARGGSYREAVVGTPRSINPILAVTDVDRDLVALIFSGLMRLSPDGTLVPDLAESVTVSEDKKTYTFVIREDAVFHDGTPVTSADVAFTVERAQNALVKSSKRANWEGVEVAVVDERTVSFTLTEPYAQFLENARLGILPKHLWENVAVTELPFSKLNTEPVGTGPFRFTEMRTTSGGIPSSILLTGVTEGARVPHLESVELAFYPDAAAQIDALEGDATLGAHSILPEGRTPHEAVLGRIFAVFFNQNQQNLFADKVVRDALDAALDKEAIVSTLIDGYGSPLSGPLPPRSLEESPSAARADAAALLEKNGWKKGDDGVWAKTVKKSTTRLAFTLRTGNADELREAAFLVRDAWKAFGADVAVELFDAGDLSEDVIRPRKYDALLFGQVVGTDADLFAFWDSSQRNDPGLNIALYTNSSVDGLLRDARRATDATERRKATEEAAAKIQAETAAIFLYSPHFVFGTPPEIRGVTLQNIVTPADRFLTIDTWYVSTERVWPLFR